MKRKQLLALVLCLAMLTALLAGCGSSSTSESTDATEAYTETSAETSAESSAAAQTSEAAGDDQASAAQASASDVQEEAVDYSALGPTGLTEDQQEMIELTSALEQELIDAGLAPGPEKTYDEEGRELSVRGVPYEYPVSDGSVTLSMWAVLNGNLTNWIEGYGDLRAWEYVQEATGIGLEFISVSESVATEQFNLMIASGSYADIIASTADTTPTELYEQEVIIRLNDYFEEYMPNYAAWLSYDEDYARLAKDDEGNVLGTYMLNMQDVPEGGNWIRSDLLEKYGMDTPVTLEEYEAFFDACKADGLEQVIGVNQDTLLTISAETFDLAGLDGAALYRIGDTVTSSYLSDACYDYVEMLANWYAKGYIDLDVFSITGAPNDSTFRSSILSGNMAVFEAQATHYADYVDSTEVEGFDLAPVGDIVLNDGDSTHFAEPMKVKTGNVALVSTTSDNPELACQLLDWFYTDDGQNTANFGQEGLTWYWDENGVRQYTDLIWNDEEFGILPANIAGIYCLQGRFSFVQNPYVGYVFQTPITVEAVEKWAETSDGDNYLLTAALSLTTDELDVVNQYLNDLDTYATEQLSSVVVGGTELTEAWWEEFTDTLERMGLNEIIAQYQSAYDRYLAR